MQLLRVLVVSLSPAFLHVVKQRLHNNVRIAEVWEAQTGQAAVEHMKEWCPDVVLLDERLQDMSLLEIALQLRAQSYRSRIVMMTMNDARPYRDALSEFSLDGVIDKTQFAEEFEAFLAAMSEEGNHVELIVGGRQPGSQQHICNRRVRHT
jgi:two-component system, NarL family, response regulator EvgA